jgi:hypothetical protein
MPFAFNRYRQISPNLNRPPVRGKHYLSTSIQAPSIFPFRPLLDPTPQTAPVHIASSRASPPATSQNQRLATLPQALTPIPACQPHNPIRLGCLHFKMPPRNLPFLFRIRLRYRRQFLHLNLLFEFHLSNGLTIIQMEIILIRSSTCHYKIDT